MTLGLIFVVVLILVLGMIVILRPIFYPNPIFPEKEVQDFLFEKGMIYKHHSKIGKKECSLINFENDINPFHNVLFFRLECYRIFAANRNSEEILIYMRWYKSYSFTFKNRAYYNFEGNKSKYIYKGI